MNISSKRSLYSLVLPGILIICASLLIWRWDSLIENVKDINEFRALLVILPMVPYILFFITTILGLRTNNIGLILVSLSYAVSYFAVNIVDINISSIPKIVLFILPLNIILFSNLKKRRFTSKTGTTCFFIMIFQIIIIWFFCYIVDNPDSRFVFDLNKEFPNVGQKLFLHSKFFFKIFSYDLIFDNIPFISILSLFTAMLILSINLVNNKNIQLAGAAGSLISAFIGISSSSVQPAMMIYFSTAGLILIITTIEASFSMAYIDELTGLAGRRSMSEAMMNLGRNYSIAMIDIDLFKKFNDTYGHKTGDQVLKMVAAKIATVSGNAKAYRFGGEEFTIIFPGKKADEAKPYLEELRENIEFTPFVVRGKERKGSSPENRGNNSFANQKTAKVTISIGVASYSKILTKPEKVLKAADKVLYKAKRAGRNKVLIQK